MLIVNDWWETKRKEIKKEVGKKFQHTSPMQATDIEKIEITVFPFKIYGSVELS